MTLPIESHPKDLEKSAVRAEYVHDFESRPGPSALKEPIVKTSALQSCWPSLVDVALCGLFRTKTKSRLENVEKSTLTKRQISELKRTIYTETQPFNVCSLL